MSKTSQRVRCQLCGGKNEADAVRCRHCTRPLHTDPMPSQALHDEAMWSRPVSTGSLRPTLSPAGVGLLIIFAAFFVNYMWIGYGPDWLSRPEQAPLAGEWRTQAGDGYRVDLPGDPIVASTADGSLNTMSVWLDNRWNLLVDSHTQARGVIRDAEQNAYAIAVTGSGAAPADLETAAPLLVASMVDDVSLDTISTSDVTAAENGSSTLDLNATFLGGFGEDNHGEVQAHLITVDGRVFVAATFYRDGVNPGLHDRLVSQFVPTALDTAGESDTGSN